MSQQNIGRLPTIIIPKINQMGFSRGSKDDLDLDLDLDLDIASIHYDNLTKERNWIITQLLVLVLIIPILVLVGIVNINDSVRWDIVYWLLLLINMFNARFQVKRLNTVNDKMLEIIMEII